MNLHPLRFVGSVAMCGVVLAGGGQVTCATDDPAASTPPGPAVEKRLDAQLDRLIKLAAAQKPDYGEIVKGLTVARKDTLVLAGQAEKKQPTEPDEVKLPARSPVVLPKGNKQQAVRALWHEQLQYNLSAAKALLPKALADQRNRARRIRGVAVPLREACRAALLLARPADLVPVTRGEQLFADDFSKGAANWDVYGQAVITQEPDGLRLDDEKVRHPDAMMWTKKGFDGNLLMEVTCVPHFKGRREGAIFAICGRPRPGKDYSVCVGGSMDTYNYGIDAYHFSIYKMPNAGNARRVGPGLKMMATGRGRPNPCPEQDKPYRVAVGKWGPTVFFMIDGKLIHSYCDAATYGPVLTAGRLGIRHWAGADASYKDFRVHRLVRAEQKPEKPPAEKGKDEP